MYVIYIGQDAYVINCIFSFMVDAADHEKLEAAKIELHNLLEKPQLAGIPVIMLVVVIILLFIYFVLFRC